jgi:chromosome segregation ATPase
MSNITDLNLRADGEVLVRSSPKRAMKTPLNEAELKRQIRALESDIDDLEDELADANSKLQKLEDELEKLQRKLSSEQTETAQEIARNVLALPHVTGALMDLANLILRGEGDVDDFVIIAEYHEMRQREEVLKGGPRA